MARKRRLLVVDDHEEMARLLADQLTDAGREVTVCLGGAQAVAALGKERPDLVITDLRMKDVDGFDVLDAAQREQPPVPVLVMTAFGAVESAVEAIKRGAAHYFTKPFSLKEVMVYVDRALADAAMRAENVRLRAQVPAAAGLLGQSPAMRELNAVIARIGPSPAPVLIRGESGTGKELVARAVHAASPRSDRPFVAVNCSALPATLLESELFGHVKGAFTGATGARRGLFVEADGGTLFLDEIGDMPAGLQARLLRVLQDGVVRPVGADQSRTTDVRIIAATHQDLEAGQRDGRFRQDLFFRLNVVSLKVPALRERPGDVPVLVRHFLDRAQRRPGGVVVERFAAGALEALAAHPWPGNVRELENAVERLVLLAAGAEVTADDVARELGPARPTEPLALALAERWTLRRLESEYIAATLRACAGNKTKAAAVLGVDASTLHRREKQRESGEVQD